MLVAILLGLKHRNGYTTALIVHWLQANNTYKSMKFKYRPGNDNNKVSSFYVAWKEALLTATVAVNLASLKKLKRFPVAFPKPFERCFSCLHKS